MARYHIFRVWRGNPSDARWVETVDAASAAEAEQSYPEETNHYHDARKDDEACQGMTYSERLAAGLE